jgi:hypothetical protein
MPVPQKFNCLVGWASRPPEKSLLRMLQDMRFNEVKPNIHLKIVLGFIPQPNLRTKLA